MITEQGLSISHVSQTIDIGITAICRWMEDYEAEQQGRPGIGKRWRLSSSVSVSWIRKSSAS